jgi:hypothetical protein
MFLVFKAFINFDRIVSQTPNFLHSGQFYTDSTTLLYKAPITNDRVHVFDGLIFIWLNPMVRPNLLLVGCRSLQVICSRSVQSIQYGKAIKDNTPPPTYPCSTSPMCLQSRSFRKVNAYSLQVRYVQGLSKQQGMLQRFDRR